MGVLIAAANSLFTLVASRLIVLTETRGGDIEDTGLSERQLCPHPRCSSLEMLLPRRTAASRSTAAQQS